MRAFVLCGRVDVRMMYTLCVRTCGAVRCGIAHPGIAEQAAESCTHQNQSQDLLQPAPLQAQPQQTPTPPCIPSVANRPRDPQELAPSQQHRGAPPRAPWALAKPLFVVECALSSRQAWAIETA
jgi:hypothetical protein